MRKRLLVVALFSLALAACGGGGGNPGSINLFPTASPSSGPTSNPTSGPTSRPTSGPTASPTSSPQSQLVQTRFALSSYVSPATLSAKITLAKVNGATPPSGLTLSVTDNITAGSCNSGCTMSGPNVPAGNDTFTVTAYGAANGSGNALSTGTQAFTVTTGSSAPFSVTLAGIPASLAIGTLPNGTAGVVTPWTPFLVTVKDASGNAISGAYSTPVTVADSDTSSLANGTALTINAGTNSASSISLTASTVISGFHYGGLAIPTATLTASASGATSATKTFTPTLSPIAYTGPRTSGSPEIDLYAASGTGSTGTFTASETGYTNAPYNQVLTVTVPAACANIGTVNASAGSGATTFNATVAASPVAGICTLSVGDAASQTASVTMTYTTNSIGVDSVKKRKP